MLKIIIASKNPVKTNAIQNGFARVFPTEVCEYIHESVPSGVSDQPMTEEETMCGAKNRTRAAQALHPDADYYVGIEGGIVPQGEDMEVIAIVSILGKDGLEGRAQASTFFLPLPLIQLIKEGKELSHAVDVLFEKNNSGHQNGCIGILTHNVLDRTSYYTEAVILALIPFVNRDLYRK